jgi:CheY-like chemotaxis protein
MATPAMTSPLASVRNMNSVNSSPLCVLVVDDCVDAATSTALLVEVWGHRVVVAHDGETALRLAGEHQPDVAFLDLGMPRMSGWQLAQRLRQLTATSEAYLVALSGYGQERDMVASQAAGCDLHLLKPVAPTLLRELLIARQKEKERHASRAADKLPRASDSALPPAGYRVD